MKSRVGSSTQRTGVTLVELMVCSVIASLLMTGILGISTSMYQQKLAMDQKTNVQKDQKSIYRLIEFDLSNSRFMSFSGRRLELTGYAAKSKTGKPLQIPCSVAYELKMVGGRRFLVRIQTPPRHPEDQRLDLVSAQVDGIDFLSFDGRGNVWKSLLWQENKNKRMSIPDIVRVQFFKNEQSLPFFDQVFSLNVLERLE